VRAIGRLGSLALAWVLALLIATVALYGVGYLASPFGPSCVTGRPGVESTQIPLGVVTMGAPILATFFVFGYAALGIRDRGWRLLAVVGVIGLTVLAGLVGLMFTPPCT